MATNDPLASQQQWIRNTIGLDRLGDQYKGLGIDIGIYDDGVQKTHSDLAGNYDSSMEVVINGATASPSDGKHGTAVAGIIAAVEGNGIGGAGIASSSRIAGVDIFSGAASGSGMISAISQMVKFDITNNSWNWTNVYSDPLTGAFGRQFNAAIESSVDNGRDGLGTVVVNSAGNDWTMDNRDANTSMFDSTRFTTTVGAVGDNGYVSSYANRGANVLVSAPSSGGSKGVATADIEGAGGYTSGDTYSFFGGTSAAAPIVSSVVALMLEANPELGWRDVKKILALSADHTGSEIGAAKVGTEAFGWSINASAEFNGGGMHFSNDYGFGQINAYAAVRLAEVWDLFGEAQTSANEASASASGTLNRALADNGVTTFTVDLAQNVSIEHVDLTLTLTHPNVKELQIELVSPDGTQSILLSPGTGAAHTANKWTWSFGSEQFLGELSAGQWLVKITDTEGGNSGTLASYKLEAFGSTVDANNVYTYTEDFSKMMAADPDRAILRDTDGGVDWINAAAVASDSVIDLNPGSISTIDGTNLIIANGSLIENAITGDGNDLLIGNSLHNQLHGGRGDDTFAGDLRGDYIHGGEGFDTVDFSARNSYVLVELNKGTASDGTRLENVEKIIATNSNDYMTGSNGDDHFMAGKGNDNLEGLGGADILDGGEGLDTASYKQSDAGVIIDLTAGRGKGGHAEDDVLISIENVQGSNFDDVITGTTSANIVWGNDGDDVFDLLGGGDVAYGGNGNDLFLSRGNGTGTNILRGDAGIDTLSYELSDTQGLVIGLNATTVAPGHTLIDVSTGMENVIGSNQNDTIRGDNLNNVIDGGNGNDLFYGLGGSDTFQFSGVNFGNDCVFDFKQGIDIISFVGNVQDFSELTFQSAGPTSCIVNAGDFGSLMLIGVQSMLLTEADFMFS